MSCRERTKARPSQPSLALSGYALAFLVGFFLPASLVFAEDCVVPAAGATNAVTLRAAPAAKSVQRGTLSPGQSLPLVASVPSWYETRLADGKAAFAAKRSTDIAPCPVATGSTPVPSGI